ncbi:MAG TPA: MATE family efflux transporter [Longimicrobiales bacterium]|nr:MATE family efflux transporter [Longimicrobiales bacterium]
MTSGLPTREESAELLRLATPIVAIQVGLMLMGVVDTVMVGRVSPVDLAAVAIGNLYFFLVAIFGMGLLMSLDPLVSQAHGAGDGEALARALQRGLVFAVVMGVLASLALMPAGAVLELFRQPPEVIPVAAEYARVAIIGVIPFYLFVVFRQTLQALGRVQAILWILVAANLANVGLNWVLVYGNLGAPALGAVGSSWASSATRIAMACGLAWVAWPVLRAYLRPWRAGVLARRPIGRMLKLGAPIGAQVFLEFSAFGLAGLMAGWVGTVALAGHQVALSLASFTFMLPLGIGQATAVLVGRGVGRGDSAAARRVAAGGMLAGVGVMVLTAVVFLLAPVPLARLFSADPTVVVLAAALLPIAGVFQIVDGIQVVSAAILRGVGDTRVPMLINFAGFYVVALPIGALLAFRADLGARGIWWGLAGGLGVVAVLLGARVRHRLAGSLARVHIDDDE